MYQTLISPNPDNPNGNGVCSLTGCPNGQPEGTACTGGTGRNGCLAYGLFCDPQLGCSDRLVAQDLSDEHAWQLSKELRLTSNFGGPLNFSIGGNYLHYETEENYYVFINTLTAYTATPFTQVGGSPPPWDAGVSDNHQCLALGPGGTGYAYPNPLKQGGLAVCSYIDPNPIGSLNNEGHNYFLSQNPYVLNSYAGFGEVYYNVTSDVKLTGGLRWTEDRKHFVDIPSELLAPGYGYPVSAIVNQQWDELTGRAVANWIPKLDFTDQTLIYGSYSHGYKAGGANPPGAVLLQDTLNIGKGVLPDTNPVHPFTFKPEFIDAFELGAKNTLLDGTLTLNADVFYYNYENYQISEIVDRTSINLNFDTHVKGAEAEATWEPLPGLRLNFAGGWEDTALAKGSQAIDLIDRTAGNSDWVLVKPFVTQASNCILPAYVLAVAFTGSQVFNLCSLAYQAHLDPITGAPYVANPNGGTFSTVWGVPISASIPRLHPTMARDSTRIWEATNCRMRRRSPSRSVHNTRCQFLRIGLARYEGIIIGRTTPGRECSTIILTIGCGVTPTST